jgi:enterobacteria phage integrase
MICSKKIRTLIKFAFDAGWRPDDPTLRIKTFPGHEFHTWTEDEIAQYEECWPIGSRERTAYALHLYTGQRRADVARMAWSDIAGNAINVVQAKTGARLTIPLHPNLSAALRAWPRKHVVMLTTAFNKPFSYAGYGNTEAGCTEKEIAAITGHTTLKEVARYTRAADQVRLAAGAVAKLTEQKPDKDSQPSKSGLEKTTKR